MCQPKSDIGEHVKGCHKDKLRVKDECGSLKHKKLSSGLKHAFQMHDFYYRSLHEFPLTTNNVSTGIHLFVSIPISLSIMMESVPLEHHTKSLN